MFLGIWTLTQFLSIISTVEGGEGGGIYNINNIDLDLLDLDTSGSKNVQVWLGAVSSLDWG